MGQSGKKSIGIQNFRFELRLDDRLGKKKRGWKRGESTEWQMEG
jgi:hypothetical protein